MQGIEYLRLNGLEWEATRSTCGVLFKKQSLDLIPKRYITLYNPKKDTSFRKHFSGFHGFSHQKPAPKQP